MSTTTQVNLRIEQATKQLVERIDWLTKKVVEDKSDKSTTNQKEWISALENLYDVLEGYVECFED